MAGVLSQPQRARASRLAVLVRLQLIIAWRPAKRGKIPEYAAIGLVVLAMGALAAGLGAAALIATLHFEQPATSAPMLLLIGGGLIFVFYMFMGLFQEGVGGGVDLSLLFHMPVSAREMTRADLLARFVSPWALPPLGFFAGCFAGALFVGRLLFACWVAAAAVLWFTQTFLILMVGDLLLYHLRRSRRFTELVGFAGMLLLVAWIVFQNRLAAGGGSPHGGQHLMRDVAAYWDRIRYAVSLLPGASALAWPSWGWYGLVVLASALCTVGALYLLAGFLLRRLMEEGTAKTARRRGAPSARRALKRPGLIERLPVWPFALRDVRYLSRDPYLKTMVLWIAVGPVIIFTVLFRPGAALGTSLLNYGAPFLILMYCAQLSNNLLGLERAGLLNTLVSPAPRWRVLLGKNLVLLALYLLIMSIPIGLLVWQKAPALDIFADLVLALGLAPIYFGLGNFASILMPTPVAPRGKRLRAQVSMGRMFMLAIMQFLLLGVAGLLAVPLFVGRFALGHLPAGGWAAGAACAAMLFYGLLIYALLLAGAAHIMPGREPAIYEAVLRGEG